MSVPGHISADRELALRYDGTCIRCGERMPRGMRGLYSPGTRSVRHLVCPVDDHGTAGSSARREHARRTARDEARTEAQKQKVREVWGAGFLGKVAVRLAVDDRPRRSTTVWAQGAVGEERVAAELDSLRDLGVVALHDRRIPRTRANIDHIAVTPWGVWVIDAKRYLGKRPEASIEGAFLGIGGTTHLKVGGRKRDGLVDQLLWQVDTVKAVVGDTAPVRGILCFVEADWPLLGGDFTVRGVRVVWPRRLAKEILRTTTPALDPEPVARTLRAAFPSA